MKIGAVYTDVNNAYYRAVWPAAGLQARGHEVVHAKVTLDDRVDLRAIEGCDVVHVYRARTPVLAKALARMRRQGTAVVYDNDDDHRLLPEGTADLRSYTGLNGHRGYRNQLQVVRQADVLTTTSALLAERLRADFDGRVEQIENYLGPFQFATGKPDHEGILIGWVAASEHRADAENLRIVDVLRRVMERDPRVRVESVGLKLSLDPARYRHTDIVPFEELAPFLSRWDIGIAPLSDIPMSHARSNVKVKEYSAAGVPWVASARGPYVRLGRGCGGMLVDDDGWEDALADLAGSRLRRRLMRRQAMAWARTQRIEKHLDRWEDVMHLAVDAAARAVA
jgi:glycosyltransferase involved in cell wall biosynthesis